MKRSWTTFAMFGGLVVLLITLGVLQFRWQSQISETQREKLRKSAQENASRFADDFNKELQNAYFNFQVGAEDWRKKNYRPFTERYLFWHGKTTYPGLISDFYFFDAAGAEPPLKYDKQLQIFSAVEWTPQLRELFARSSNKEDFHPVYEDIYTLILPEHEMPPEVGRILRRRQPAEIELRSSIPDPVEMPKTYGYLAIMLDPSVIREEILPGLAAKYFGDGDFNLTVADKSGNVIYQPGVPATAADVQAGIFEITPGDIFFFANQDLENSMRKKTVVLNSRIETHSLARTQLDGNENSSVKVEIQNAGRPITQVQAAKVAQAGEHWTLSAQNKAGSIDNYIANTRDRDLAAGFGILALLGSAVGAIIVSTQRSRAFAQRQIDFVSGVSHEFRTPLAVIYSAAENLADGVANDGSQIAKYGELIKGEGRKLSSMVEQILSYAGANAGKLTYSFSPTNISGVVRDAIRECGPLLNDQNIEFESDLDDNLPLVNADGDALSRAIQNLIANSVKYRNGSNWIKVSTRNGESTIKMIVEDHGIGVSGSELSKIFEPFYRSKQVIDAQIHGNGLGLALVKQIVEAHGGRVTAASEPGEGSRFTIEIPVQ